MRKYLFTNKKMEMSISRSLFLFRRNWQLCCRKGFHFLEIIGEGRKFERVAVYYSSIYIYTYIDTCRNLQWIPQLWVYLQFQPFDAHLLYLMLMCALPFFKCFFSHVFFSAQPSDSLSKNFQRNRERK